MFLILHDGRQVEFTEQELGSTLSRLQALDQSYCTGSYDVAHIRVGGSLLLLDVGWVTGRRLLESFAIAQDLSRPFGLRFSAGSAQYSLEEALSAAGYVGAAVTELSQVYMAMFAAAAQGYLAPGQLVADVGAFQTSPAVLKVLEAGAGVTITEQTDKLVLAAAADTSALEASVAANTAALATKQDALSVTAPFSGQHRPEPGHRRAEHSTRQLCGCVCKRVCHHAVAK